MVWFGDDNSVMKVNLIWALQSQLSARHTWGKLDSWALLPDILIQVQDEALASVCIFFFQTSQIIWVISQFWASLH